MLRNYGSRRRYNNEITGNNSRLDPVQAAVLGVKLPHLEEWNRRRRHLAAGTRPDSPGAPAFRGRWSPGAEPVWHLYVIRARRRDALQAHLKNAGIETFVHYPIPPHQSGAYRGSRWAAMRFPIAERLAQEVLSLPIGPDLGEADQDRVIAAIRKFS